MRELMETLEAIKHIIENNDFDDILLLGDINADFLRNSAHCNQVKSFIEELNLMKSWAKFEVDFTMCHEVNDQVNVATIDHFFWNESLDEKVIDAGVIHSPDNFSDHCPIYCFINEDIPISAQHVENNAPPKPKWKKATVEEKESFKEHLEEQLRILNVPDSCLNVHCKDNPLCGCRHLYDFNT